MSTQLNSSKLSQQEANDIAIEAYIYFYSIISMDVTRRLMTNLPLGVKEGYGPQNLFHHMRSFPDANFRDVVRPNFDTLYSASWIDLTKEPVIVSVPDTNDRYYLLPMLDMWSEVFAVPGKRTSGTKAANYAVIPKGWKGTLPNDVEVIECPTSYFWIIGRTQTNGVKDYESVHKVQNGFKVTTLYEWGKTQIEKEFVPDPSVDMKTPPLLQVDNMPADKYFSYGAELMKLHSPHLTDWSQIERMKSLGIEPGKSFNFQGADPIVKSAMESAPKKAQKLMKEKVPTITKVINGWSMSTDTMGAYGNAYLKRAIIAQIGLGANQVEDAIYPINICDGEGNPLDGKNNYIIHFGKEELPPVNAFWSITMYDNEGFQSANEINRFAIGDRDNLKYNSDGSLDIYIQHSNPGQDKVDNWLPSPQCPLGVTMRLYAPKADVVNGIWNPPAIKRVK